MTLVSPDRRLAQRNCY